MSWKSNSSGLSDVAAVKHPFVLVICGPTASGKSNTALEIALQQDGEIVSADSMQIYRGMDIGTAKVTPKEQALIRHHLIDCCEPGESFSVARFKELATAAIRDIQARGKLAIVCGGTGQYIRALVQGITYVEIPADLNLRATLNQRAREEGLNSLFRELSEVDPVAAQNIKPQDQKRIVRALEIYHQTGRPKTDHVAESLLQGPEFNFIVYCLNHQRAVLYDKINQRVQTMIDQGLVEEVRQLMASTAGTAATTAWQAIGYKEIIAYLQGQKGLQEAVSDIAQATRRYAKRQLTWFRKMPDVHWIEDLSPDQAACLILDELKKQAIF
jgi:tRNA dimethylallyltransferase